MRSKKWRKAWKHRKDSVCESIFHEFCTTVFRVSSSNCVFHVVVFFQAAISARLPCSQVGGGGNNVPVGVEVRVNNCKHKYEIVYIHICMFIHTAINIYLYIPRENRLKI